MLIKYLWILILSITLLIVIGNVLDAKNGKTLCALGGLIIVKQVGI